MTYRKNDITYVDADHEPGSIQGRSGGMSEQGDKTCTGCGRRWIEERIHGCELSWLYCPKCGGALDWTDALADDAAQVAP